MPVTLLLSSLALIAAPVLYGMLERSPRWRDALDGFVLITIAGIVCLHIVPQAWRLAGWASLVSLAAGIVFPLVLERIYRRALERAHLFVLMLAAVGVVVHAVLDGIALLPDPRENGLRVNELALGVILHRLPVGIAVWWVLRPQFGVAAAVAVMGVIVLVTGLGYFFGAGLLEADLTRLALFQSFVAGSILHVALVGTADGHTGAVDSGRAGHSHAGDDAHRLPALPALRAGAPFFWVGVGIGLITVLLLPHVSPGL